MSDDRLHPSSLGSWAGCPKRTWRELEDGRGRDVPTIAAWVGSSAHALAAGLPMPPDPVGMALFDSLTPSTKVARLQASQISGVVRHVLEVHGLSVVSAELAVEDGSTSGVLDLLIKYDVPKQPLVILDLKTGQNVPAGAWLQLGSYFDAYNYEHPDEPAGNVAVIHVPRAAPLAINCEAFEIRPGPPCAAASRVLIADIDHWMRHRDRDTVPAYPGFSCHSCPLTSRDCAVRIIDNPRS